MATRLVHTCLRVRDENASVAFYERLGFDDLDGLLAELAEAGIEPEKPPFAPGGRDEIGRICFVADPDGYRVELIDGGEFPTPQDPPHPDSVAA
jgi:catechol 2,3-dioxygenase-like lactoylglutathione lyase family enzyme